MFWNFGYMYPIMEKLMSSQMADKNTVLPPRGVSIRNNNILKRVCGYTVRLTSTDEQVSEYGHCHTDILPPIDRPVHTMTQEALTIA